MTSLQALIPRSVSGVTLATVAALVPPALVTAFGNPTVYVAQLTVALMAVLAAEGAFAALRKRRFSAHGVTTALIVTCLTPPELAFWQLALGLVLGVLLADLIFGGRGFGFLNAAAVALALLLFSFPELHLTQPTPALTLATVPGAAVLVVLGLVSWRIILGVFLGIVGSLALVGHPLDPVAIGTGIAFGLVFLFCDPTAAAATNPGRWVFGVLAGGLVVLFSAGPALTSQAVIFGSLLASVFAPLIDHLVVLAHARWRRARHA